MSAYIGAMHHRLLVSLLALSGCNFATVETETATPKATATAQALKPALRPVRIGEGGPGFPACQSRGYVATLEPGGTTAALLDAPFAQATTVRRLGEGIPILVCTRTLDQRWLGVVIAPPGTPEATCGVGGRVSRPQAYDGPCPTGWIAANTVRLTGS